MKKIFGQIERLKTDLWIRGVRPKTIHLSPIANEMLLMGLQHRDGKKHTIIFEICGLTVKVDPECPPGGGYIVGEELEDLNATTRKSGN